MSKEILKDIINDFSIEKFNRFFRTKNDRLAYYNTPLDYNDGENNFTQGNKLAEGELDDGKIGIYSFKVLQNLSERSGKKAQYEIGKKVLKKEQTDAGIFIFYDGNGNFRFSLIHINYTGTRKQWSSKRFTYFVSKEETNKTFLQRIGDGDFSSITTIKDAFSVEKVTKEFYQEIANWYFWALKEAKFPKDAEEEPNGRNIALIRLITRLIFIWFMRQKGIVKKELFDKESLKDILKNFSDDNGSFYLAILQNLFFATLNTPIEQRKFRREEKYKGYLNKDYMNHNYFRHHSLFKAPDKMKEIFNDIPFLNGGLFECLDKAKNDESNDTGREIRIDGFSDNPKKQPCLPNFLFFSEEKEVDLNEDYGTNNKNYKVRGIINILSSYNFTIDENTPIDEEVALDPELLGRVFENLLASYNPETAMTARKATGSYYTPREIVNYMVSKSLKEYFKSNVAGIDENKLNQLFLYDDDKNPFDEDTTKKLINAIHNLKLLDPAVGSGAFPMGALHCLVHILHKLDPHNEKWKAEQIKVVNNITDPKIRQETLKRIEESFTLNELDYGRKLYLIQNCIYGVDIQPIAIQISKLRFFISLLVDEKVNKTKPNYGIEPLPNLETKFVAADTLINLNNKLQFLPQRISKIKDLKKELFNIRQEHFNTQDTHKKHKLRELDKKYRKEMQDIIKNYISEKYQMLEELKKELQSVLKEKHLVTVEVKDLFETKTIQVDQNELKRREIQNKINQIEGEIKAYEKMLGSFQKIINWNIYDTNKSAGWFDSEWMFGISDGFDIVIGNPPYVSTKGVDDQFKKILESQYGFADDTYNHFYFKGMEILKDKGIISYISSKTFWTIQTKKNLRDLLLKNKLLLLFDTANPFESAMVDTCVTIAQKQSPDKEHTILFLDGKKNLTQPEKYTIQQQVYANTPNNVFFAPTEYNLKIYERLGKKVNELLNQWWDKISTSKNIEKHKKLLEQYRKSLKPGDITLLGLITEGGVGIQTGNNGKFVGVLEGTKWAEKVKKERPEKLLLALQFCKQQGITSKQQAQDYLEKLSEKDIRNLFDTLKEQYGRDIFGQGWLYRIVNKNEIAYVEKLTEDEKLNGIAGDKTFVPYDKGDKDGNRWYAPTPYYIDWSRENVKFLQNDPKARWQGYQFYFCEGFCWNNVTGERIICRIKEKSVHSTEAMTFISLLNLAPDFYIVCLMNSSFFGKYKNLFLNVTVHLTTGDAKEFPIIIPTAEELKIFESIFNRAYEIQKQKFANEISESEAEKQLEIIQKELDEIVEKMYMGE